MSGESAEHERGITVARDALRAAMREDWPAMTTAVESLSGSQALIVAITAWCDTLLAHHPDGFPRGGQPVRVAWMDKNAGQVQHAEDVPMPVRWAGQVLAARAAMDEDGFWALMNAPSDGLDFGTCVSALVASVAQTLEAITRA